MSNRSTRTRIATVASSVALVGAVIAGAFVVTSSVGTVEPSPAPVVEVTEPRSFVAVDPAERDAAKAAAEAQRVAAEQAAAAAAQAEAERIAAEQAAAAQAEADVEVEYTEPEYVEPAPAPVVPGDQQAGECREWSDTDGDGTAETCTATYVP